MAWPEESGRKVGSTWYLQWQSDAEASFRARKKDGFLWNILFTVKSVVYGYVVFNVLRFLKRKVPRLLGYGPLRRDPNIQKFRRVVMSSPMLQLSLKAFVNFLKIVFLSSLYCVG